MQDYGKLVALQDRNFILATWKNVLFVSFQKNDIPLKITGQKMFKMKMIFYSIGRRLKGQREI